MMGSEQEPRELLGRFRLGRRLGSGGMGVVYEALDGATGARVALKTLHERSSSFLLQLKREFRAVHGLQHPNLVALGELFQAGERWFFTMELVEGEDYTSWLRAGSRSVAGPPSETDVNAQTLVEELATATLPDPSALACLPRIEQSLPQLASALAALHGAGLVHGDIKPSNMLMTTEGRLVVLDFGLVRSTLLDEQQSSQVAGTIAYMAPEQAEAGPITPAVDCYALGVVLYEALTGRLPFVGTPADILMQKRSWAPVQPSLLVSGIPPHLEQLCLELLAREASARPTSEQIVARLGPKRLPRASTPATPTRPFVGRTEELRRLSDLFDGLVEGQPAALLVQGDSGIGKTALLHEACRRTQQAAGPLLILRGRCFERETVAYAGLDMAMDVLAATLKRLPSEQAAFFIPRYSDLLCQLFPTLAAVPGFGVASHTRLPMSSHEARTRARSAFHELFARLCMRYRVVLFVDDAQWLSDESLGLLASLFSPDDRMPLLLLLSSRPLAAARLRTWLETLACPLSELLLGPLAAHESVELLRQYPLAVDGDALAALASEGAGHPLFLHELAGAAREGAPSTEVLQLDACLRSRASHLPAAHRDVLDLVCAAARPMGSGVIATAACVAPAELATILRDLQHQRFLVTERSGAQIDLQPVHDRVRQALLEELPREGRRELQRRLARALEQQNPVDVDALALQWSAAEDWDRAAGFARQAAAHAVGMLAFERALELYALALRDTAASAAERGAIHAAQGDALANLGRGPEAAAAYLEATRHCPAVQVDDLVMRGADQLIRSGRVDDGRRLLERVLERLEIKLPESQANALRALVLGRVALKLTRAAPRKFSAEERARQLRRIDACWTVGDLLGLVDPIRSADLHSRGLRFAIEVGEPIRLARSLASDAWFVASSGARAGRSALARLRQAESLIQNQSSPHTEGWVTLCRGIVTLQMGDFDEAQREFDAAEAVFERRCQGAFFEASYAREFGVWALAYRGQLGPLRERLPRAIELATVTDNRLALLRLRCGPSHVALLAADEPQQLIVACSATVAGLSQETYPFPHLCTLFARVHAAIYLGRAADALRAIEGEQPQIQRAQLLRNQFFRVDLAGLRARAALAAMAGRSGKDAGRLAEVARKSAGELRREDVAWARALAATIEASLQTLERRTAPSAAAALTEAAEHLARCGLGLYADAVRYQAQRFAALHDLAGAGQPSSAWSDRTLVARPERLAQTFAPLPVL